MTVQSHAEWTSFLRDIGELDPAHALCPDSDKCESTEKYRPLRLVGEAGDEN